MRQLNKDMQYVLSNRNSDMAHLQEMLSTGKRLMRPSDDAVDVANDLQLRTNGTQQLQFKDNINDGLAFMSITDTSMNSMNDLFQRLRELAIQGSSDTLTGKERSYILKEVDQLFRQLVTLVNTNYKGDYIFGGTQTKIQPLPVKSSAGGDPLNYSQLAMAWYNGAAGGVGAPAQLRNAFTGENITQLIPGSFRLSAAGVNYVEGRDYTVDYVNGTVTPLAPALAADVSDGGLFSGPNYAATGFAITFDYVSHGRDVYGDPVSSTGDVLREVENGTVMPVNIPLDELLRDPDTGIDMVNTVVRLGQGLQQNNRGAIETSINEIDTVFKTIMSAQTKNGARINRFDSTLGRNEQQHIETTRLQSEIEDADFAETASQFSLMETVYNAALKSAAAVIKPTLADFL
jgi:flagellar hook-associated protein 3 FlgL